MTFCLRELLQIVPAEVARDLERRGHDGAAVARMRLDHLAAPFRIEQIGEALRRVLGFHQIGVVGDDAEPDAEAREQPSASCARRDSASPRPPARTAQDALAPPDDEMGGVRGVHHVDRVDAARILLADALEHALGAGALDAHGDARVFGLERLGDLLGERQVDRGVVDDLAFLLRGFDQRRRDRGRRAALRRARAWRATARAPPRPSPEHIAARNSPSIAIAPTPTSCPVEAGLSYGHQRMSLLIARLRGR